MAQGRTPAHFSPEAQDLERLPKSSKLLYWLVLDVDEGNCDFNFVLLFSLTRLLLSGILLPYWSSWSDIWRPLVESALIPPRVFSLSFPMFKKEFFE